MKRIPFDRIFRVVAPLTLAGVVACSDDNGTGPDPDPDPQVVTNCSTTIANEGTFVELCALTSPVRHVRIENLKAPATHASAQIVFGFDAPPSSAQADLAANQFRVLFYGGGTPAPSPIIQASYGNADATVDGNVAFINTGATVCFDLHDGSATTAPAFVLWVDGQRGANCSNRSTLTATSAFAARTYWGGTKGAVAKQAKVYFRQAAGGGTTPVVALSAEPVLTEAAIAATTTCTTGWATNTDWQQLCKPAGGVVKHVRLEGVQSSANNSYFYAVFGQDANPTGNPAAAAGKLIVTGGRSSSGASWTWFRFGTGSTTQFNYATDAPAALYTEAPATICFDIGSNDEGNARFTFWATGAKGANCTDRSTLTLERALYNSVTDATTASIWNAPLIADKLEFIKTNNANVTIGNVVLFAEPALP